jgi:kinesin family member 2/24
MTKYIEEHSFTFDNVYDEFYDNMQIYTEIVQPLVQQAFSGTKITCFAYGQTGSGKTYTMMGAPNKGLELNSSSGMFLLAAHDIISYIKNVSELLRKSWD